MSKIKVVPVVGTVGVPARYGGFETLAEQLCNHISATEIRFVVYCDRHSYAAYERSGSFNGHQRVFLPLKANGIASLFYDALALVDAVFLRHAQEVFIFGYSGAWILPLLKLLKPRVRFIVNVDGMEWRRDKHSLPAKILLKALELCAARAAAVIIADNAALADLFYNRYRIDAVVIAYGGDHTLVRQKKPVTAVSANGAAQGHYLAIARIEPENNSEMIIQGCIAAGVPLVYIGNWTANKYGISLRARYGNAPNIILHDPIYDQGDLAQWRVGAVGYIHGHSVGGTNPSLVEALFHTERLASFDCPFNRATLSNVGDYFENSDSLAALLRAGLHSINPADLSRLRDLYSWERITTEYRNLLV